MHTFVFEGNHHRCAMVIAIADALNYTVEPYYVGAEKNSLLISYDIVTGGFFKPYMKAVFFTCKDAVRLSALRRGINSYNAKVE